MDYNILGTYWYMIGMLWHQRSQSAPQFPFTFTLYTDCRLTHNYGNFRVHAREVHVGGVHVGGVYEGGVCVRGVHVGGVQSNPYMCTS